ncbi:hypothetical protein ACFQGT_19480 [Natrialbaceae archaeon GCM10025810]|uniref:hypothetical protein n=1 Tax=Halovalidus salilacus TaxID=3075124 RepID=UPI00361FE7C4
MCDHPSGCSNEATCQLTLRNEVTGLESVEYYCKAHFVARMWELDGDSRQDAVGATTLESEG